MQLCPQSSNTLRAKEINRVNFYVTDISEEYFLSFHVFQRLVILCHRASCGRGWPFFFFAQSNWAQRITVDLHKNALLFFSFSPEHFANSC